MDKDSGIETLALDAPGAEADTLVERASRRAVTRRGAVGLLGGAGAFALGGLPIAPAQAEVRIDITRGNIEPACSPRSTSAPSSRPRRA